MRETLGSHLRAGRLGFRPIYQLGAYVQIRGEPGRWVMELCSPDQLPKHPYREEYRVWWEDDSLESEFVAIVRRKFGSIRLSHGRVLLTLDDNGEILD